MITWKDGTERKLPVMFPATAEAAEDRQQAEGNTRRALLRAMLANPSGTLREWGDAAGIKSTATVFKRLGQYEVEKLVEKAGDRWLIT